MNIITWHWCFCLNFSHINIYLRSCFGMSSFKIHGCLRNGNGQAFLCLDYFCITCPGSQDVGSQNSCWSARCKASLAQASSSVHTPSSPEWTPARCSAPRSMLHADWNLRGTQSRVATSGFPPGWGRMREKGKSWDPSPWRSCGRLPQPIPPLAVLEQRGDEPRGDPSKERADPGRGVAGNGD